MRKCKHCSEVITSTAKHRCAAITKAIAQSTILVGVPSYARPGTSVTSTSSVSESQYSQQNDGFAQSMAIGFATNNGLLGGLISGSIAGGIMGDLMNGGFGD